MRIKCSSEKVLTYGTIAVVVIGVWLSVAMLIILSFRAQDSPNTQSLTPGPMPTKNYPVRIQYQTRAGTVIKVGAQRIYYASQATVRDSWGPIIERHYENLQNLSQEIRAIESKITTLESKLKTARATASDAYRDAEREVAETNQRPASGKKRLAQLLAAAAEFEDAEENASTVVVNKIAPIKADLNYQRQLLGTKENELRRTRGHLPDVMFSALPRRSVYVTTDESGLASLQLPSEAKFYCWADFSKTLPNGQPERLRWLLLLPDNLDANGNAIMSHDNTYESMDFEVVPDEVGESGRIAPLL